MRCDCCNVILTPYELSIKSAESGEYLMMCGVCLKTIKGEVQITANKSLEHEDGTVFADINKDNSESLPFPDNNYLEEDNDEEEH